MSRRHLLVLLPLLLLPSLALAQRADDGRGRPDDRRAQVHGGDRGMSAAVRRVQRETGGQVLNVESMRFQGRDIHRVKVLGQDGRVRIVVDDPVNRRGGGDSRGGDRGERGRPTRRDDGRRPNL
ncbi:hypothetical protein [Luteimonas sp. e5]